MGVSLSSAGCIPPLSYQGERKALHPMGDDERAKAEAYADVEREYEQGFQGWEYKFNTVAVKLIKD